MLTLLSGGYIQSVSSPLCTRNKSQYLSNFKMDSENICTDIYDSWSLNPTEFNDNKKIQFSSLVVVL